MNVITYTIYNLFRTALTLDSLSKTLNRAKRQRHKRENEQNRSKRNTPWSGDVQEIPSFSLFQPQTQQISRPYFIPIWYQGPNRIPVYLPPQPVPVNPGYPQHNRPGPQNAYLPPPPRPTNDLGQTIPDLNNRIDSNIYWGVVEAPDQPNVPQGGGRPSNNRNPSTTRRPASSGDRNQGKLSSKTNVFCHRLIIKLSNRFSNVHLCYY